MNGLAHAKLGASSMHRWSKCPGSIRQSESFTPRESIYASEGSDAHAYAAFCLTRPRKATKVEDIGKERQFDGRIFTPTEDMRDAVETYCLEVRHNLDRRVKIRIEQRFDLSSVYPGCFGTADCVIWRPATKMLIVIDYKHGAGIPVEVEDNPQLLYYGLGALLSTGYPATTVRLIIVQPRRFHPDGPVRSWDVPAMDLIDFRADLIGYAKATEDPNALLNPGDWCYFCPGRSLCPALTAQATELAKIEFGPKLPYDPKVLKRALDARDAIKAWLKGLDEFAYAEAEAGRCSPGYKLVAKRPTRKWRDDVEVVEHLRDLGLSTDVIFAPLKPKPPAQLEKLVDKKAIESFIVKVSSGHVLAPESDKRPPVRPAAKDEFQAIPKGIDTDDR